MTFRQAIECVCAALTLLGCSDPLAAVEKIEGTRVLGARVEVAGDPARVSARPAEDLHVRWLVVAPEPAASFAWKLEACIASSGNASAVTCIEPPFAAALNAEPLPDAPSLDFIVPAGIDAAHAARLAVLGSVCPNGVALADSSGKTCDDGSTAQAVSLDFDTDDGVHTNHNPAFLGITLDGAAWAQTTADTLDCDALPQLSAASGGHALELTLDPASRDALVPENSADPTRETLLVSYFTTAGDLDRAYTVIPSDATQTTSDVNWAPATVSTATLARLFFVVRDGRGGSDFMERHACLLP